ncbi:MAG TPA: glutamate--tRNA ligase, partial [Candidatus Obscuribacterales bacterium]
VRIAPSPTGNLHIGTTRTALFNYLFARHHGGTFILRVEDTDRERSKHEYTENILSGLKGLGLSWDEGHGAAEPHGPYYQSQRQAIYARYLQQLIEHEKIYPCFCSPAELQAERATAEAAGVTYVYSRKCRKLDTDSVKARLAAGDKKVWRLKVPEHPVVFDDLIRGPINIDAALIGDIIIASGDLTPMYNFAVVVDDIHMIVSHVLRGEDHISNTPKQILIYEALGAKPPLFGHAAMMLAPDRSKLSKRHGATSVQAYLDMGYLPEALVNYLALLGWSAPEGKEILSLSELVEAFDLDHVTKSGAIFDVEKLKWVNTQWLRRLGPEGLWPRLQPLLAAAGHDVSGAPESWWLDTLRLVIDKLVLLPDYLQQCDFLIDAELIYQPAEVEKAFSMASASAVIDAFAAAFEKLESWDYTALQTEFESLKSALPYKPKEVMWPLRAALTGRVSGADLQQSIMLLGRARTLARLKHAQAQLGAIGAQE